MRKLSKISLAILTIACIFCFMGVRAAEEPTLTLETDLTDVKPGETFTVSIKATAEEEINGLTGRLEYDTNVLECDVSSIVVSSNFNNIGTFPEIGLQAKDRGTKTDTLYSVNFKAKAAATVGNTTVKLTKSQEASKLFLDTVEGDGKEFDDKTVVINIKAAEEGPIQEITSSKLTGISITTQPKKLSYKIGEKFDKTGMIVTATYEDGTKKEVTNYTYEPAGELKETDKTVTITFKDGDIEKKAQVKIAVSQDGTKSPETKIAQTGIADNSIAFVAVIALVIVSYAGIRKYRGI